MTHNAIIEAAAIALTILRRKFPSVISIDEPIVLKESGRSLVLRCAIIAKGERRSVPESVIVKKILASPECGFSDWSSLDFMSRAPERSGLAPAFHGGAIGEGIYIMEDLGGSASLDDLLRGESEADAVAGLTRLAGQCAQLHRSTAGEEEEFARIRGSLPGADTQGRHREGERWLAALGRIREWFAATDTPIDERFDRECDRLNGWYIEPGAFLAFTHGDIAPSNNHVRDGIVHLIDFEYGGFRHALYDMAVWNVLCPLPEPLLPRLLEEYRACYMPGDRSITDAEFAREWDRICTWRGIGMLGWFTPKIMEENRPWVEEWSACDAFLRTLRMIASRASGLEEASGIAASFAGLADALTARWPETAGTIPRWRALDGMGR